MIHDDDFVQSITLDGGDDGDRVSIWKIREQCFLICIIDPTVDPKVYTPELEDALDMIEQSKFLPFSLSCQIFFFYSNHFFESLDNLIVGILHEDFKLTVK